MRKFAFVFFKPPLLLAVLLAFQWQAIAQGDFGDPSINGQREQLANYETAKLYFQLKPGFQFNSAEMDKASIGELESFPLLYDYLNDGTVELIEQRYQVLAQQDEGISRIYSATISDPERLEDIISEIGRQHYIAFSEKVPVYELLYSPNDPLYLAPASNWHLTAVNAEDAWDITMGCNTVVIAVVDDAVLTGHEDLINKIASGGYDVADNDSDPNPPGTATNSFFTHGTHVAGIAAAETDNLLGNASIGFNSMILPVKVKKDNNTSPSALDNPMDGVQYAMTQNPDVINMSWGSYSYSAADQMVFNLAWSQGIVCVAAAGNGNPMTGQGYPFLAYPAGYVGVISAGAIDQSNDRAVFSNYSGDLDVFAPGVDIWSTLAGSNSSYGAFSGTSMSSPMVAGLAALMICNNPTYGPFEISNCLSSTANVVPSINTPGFNLYIIDADAALHCVPPIVYTCLPGNCELISNGGFEVPAHSGVTAYGWQALNLNRVCSWGSYFGTSDCHPQDIFNSDNYATFTAYTLSGANPFWYEGATSNSMNLIPGQEYIVEFDYSIATLNGLQAPQTMDSVVVALLDNSYVFANFATGNTILIDAITQAPSNFQFNNTNEFLTGTATPLNSWVHHTVCFTAPSNPVFDVLLIYIRDAGTYIEQWAFLDNVSVRPKIHVEISGGDDTLSCGACDTLIASGADDYIWEPEECFADPTNPIQIVCPDSTKTYTVTGYDQATGCTGSDTITIVVDDSVQCCPCFQLLDCCTYWALFLEDSLKYGNQEILQAIDEYRVAIGSPPSESFGPDSTFECDLCNYPVDSFPIFVVDSCTMPVTLISTGDYTIIWSNNPGQNINPGYAMIDEEVIVTVFNEDSTCTFIDTFLQTCCIDTGNGMICCDTFDLEISIEPFCDICDPCENPNIPILVQVVGPNGPLSSNNYSFLWGGGYLGSGNGNSEQVYVNTWIWVTVTDLETGCTVTDSFIVVCCETNCCETTIPTNLQAVYTSGIGGELFAHLSWDPVPGALSYIVEIGWNDPECCQTHELPTGWRYYPTLNYVDFEVHPDRCCFSWKVQAICDEQTTSPWSVKKCEDVCEWIDPPCETVTPINLQAVYSSGINGELFAHLYWDPVPGAVSYIVEIGWNDPECCHTHELPTGWRYYPTLNFVDFEVHPDRCCFSWKVQAICDEKTASPWSVKICEDVCEWIDPDGGKEDKFKRGLGNFNNSGFEEQTLMVYPNPTTGELKLQLDRLGDLNGTILVFDVVGRVVKQVSVNDTRSFVLDLAKMNDGVYTVIYKSDAGNRYIKKVILTKDN